MSRIIVKQLPKQISEEKLRNLFSSKGGIITDIQLKYTPDGKFRQFCFIGYSNEEEAQKATTFFNNTCIQTSRIKVELCASLGDESKPQSWSKYSKDSKKNLDAKAPTVKEDKAKKGDKTRKFDEIIGKHKDDPEFQEFMKVHDKHRTLWANDADMQQQTPDVASKQTAASDDSDNDSVEDLVETVGTADASDEDNNKGATKAGAEEERKLAEKPISDLEYMKSLISGPTEKAKVPTQTAVAKSPTTPAESIDLFTIKIHNVPYKTKRQEILKFFKPLKPYSVRLPTNVHGFCYVGFKTEKDMTRAMIKDKSFIKGKQVFFSDFTEKNKVSKSKRTVEGANGERNNNVSGSSAGGEYDNTKWIKQRTDGQNEENISVSGIIFFRNLAYTVTDDDLQKLFEQFGPVANIYLPVDAVTRQIKGFGTVSFVMPEHAVKAFNLDGTIFHGRLLHLIPGKDKDDKVDANDTDAALSFKQKKAIMLKKSANQSYNWNTLFLGANAVADILANRFDTTKEKILDTSEGGSSAAVRLALGETQIVVEMKQFLEDNGVYLNAFDTPAAAKRSKTVILAKNLPAATTVDELTPLFAKFGPIGRIVLPPSGVTALIEFCAPSEASQAFKKLAYSKFKTAPLYLEWAPANTFRTTLNGETIIPKVEAETNVAEDETATTKKLTETQLGCVADDFEAAANNTNDDAEDAEWANEAPEPGTTLFLRNLNFKTRQDTVRDHFKHLGPIHTVEVAQRRDAADPRNFVSLGYGFIQFKRSATAEQALKRMQFTTIDGNQVELKRSDRILKSAEHETQRKSTKTKAQQQTGTKILVRNIPFQANVNEVRDIFKAFGEIRSVRLPQKMTPGETTHRGFGFVDYLTKSDARKAFAALGQSTHLYGRRLVLEWASTDDEDVGELRKRTAEHFNQAGDQSSSLKRSKKAIFDVDAAGGDAGAQDNDDDA